MRKFIKDSSLVALMLHAGSGNVLLDVLGRADIGVSAVICCGLILLHRPSRVKYNHAKRGRDDCSCA